MCVCVCVCTWVCVSVCVWVCESVSVWEYVCVRVCVRRAIVFTVISTWFLAWNQMGKKSEQGGNNNSISMPISKLPSSSASSSSHLPLPSRINEQLQVRAKLNQVFRDGADTSILPAFDSIEPIYFYHFHHLEETRVLMFPNQIQMLWQKWPNMISLYEN